MKIIGRETELRLLRGNARPVWPTIAAGVGRCHSSHGLVGSPEGKEKRRFRRWISRSRLAVAVDELGDIYGYGC